jgi:hypothetical protein
MFVWSHSPQFLCICGVTRSSSNVYVESLAPVLMYMWSHSFQFWCICGVTRPSSDVYVESLVPVLMDMWSHSPQFWCICGVTCPSSDVFVESLAPVLMYMWSHSFQLSLRSTSRMVVWKGSHFFADILNVWIFYGILCVVYTMLHTLALYFIELYKNNYEPTYLREPTWCSRYNNQLQARQE